MLGFRIEWCLISGDKSGLGGEAFDEGEIRKLVFECEGDETLAPSGFSVFYVLKKHIGGS